MKTILMIALLALPAVAGDVSVTFRDDAGKIVATTTFTMSNEVLAAIGAWRLEQIETPATTDANGKTIPAVLRYPTTESLWRGVFSGFVRAAVGDRLPAVQLEQVKIRTANERIATLKEAVVSTQVTPVR